MSSDRATTALRGARAARGWSQSEAARELAALGERRATPVAAAPSLKTLLSRWENGHAHPEPQYRTLLAELYGRSPAELGIDDAAGSAGPGSPAERLRAAVAAAAGPPDSDQPDTDQPDTGPWQAQLETVRRLDAEFGVAGTGGLVAALVEQLQRRLVHALTPGGRDAAARVLTGAAALAGVQSLDRAEHDVAWRQFERARSAAIEARRPVAAAVALAGMAAALVDAGDAAAAITLLEHAPPDGPPPAAARVAAALGHARAATGNAPATRAAFATAFSAVEQALRDATTTTRRTRGHPDPAARLAPVGVDAVETTGPAFELAALHGRHGHALLELGEPGAAAALHTALAAGPRSARHLAALHADLASALATERPGEATEHADAARALALRIGSVRIAARLARPPGSDRRR